MTRAGWKSILARVASLLRGDAAAEFDAFRAQWEREQIELGQHRRNEFFLELQALKASMRIESDDIDDGNYIGGRP